MPAARSRAVCTARTGIGGNAGLETLVFGTIAGKSAAEYLQAVQRLAELDDETVDDFVCDTLSLCGKKPVEAELLAKLRAQMGEILSDKLNVLRCGTELCIGGRRIRRNAGNARGNPRLDGVSAKLKFDTIRLVNRFPGGISACRQRIHAHRLDGLPCPHRFG